MIALEKKYLMSAATKNTPFVLTVVVAVLQEVIYSEEKKRNRPGRGEYRVFFFLRLCFGGDVRAWESGLYAHGDVLHTRTQQATPRHTGAGQAGVVGGWTRGSERTFDRFWRSFFTRAALTCLPSPIAHFSSTVRGVGEASAWHHGEGTHG